MTDIAIDFETDTFPLPPPVLPVQATLVDALRQRTSSRSFSRDPLSAEQISALLWAAFGINRPSSHGRTAPSAHNWKEMDIYVVLAEGAYRYEPRTHRLLLVKAEDLRFVPAELSGGAGQPVLQAMHADFPFLASATTDFALGEVWGRSELDARTRQLATVAVFAAQGNLPQMKIHAGYALRAGVSPAELKEMIYLTTVTAGFPRAIDAAQALREVLAAQQAGEG